MWQYVLMVILLMIILTSSRQTYNQNGGNPNDSNEYYRQHSRFPMGAWWIPFSDPRERCQAIARNHCHNKFNYDDCYENILNHCRPSDPPNPDLLPY